MTINQHGPPIANSIKSFFRDRFRKFQIVFEHSKKCFSSTLQSTERLPDIINSNKNALPSGKISETPSTTDVPSFILTRYDSFRARREHLQEPVANRTESVPRSCKLRQLKTPKAVSIQNERVVLPRRCLLPTELWDSIDLHMTLVEARHRKDLRIKQWTTHERELRERLEMFRTEIVKLVAFAWLKYGLKLFVHDFLYVEEGHNMNIVMPLATNDFRKWAYTRWQMKVNTFREGVEQCAINHMLSKTDLHTSVRKKALRNHCNQLRR